MHADSSSICPPRFRLHRANAVEASTNKESQPVSRRRLRLFSEIANAIRRIATSPAILRPKNECQLPHRTISRFCDCGSLKMSSESRMNLILEPCNGSAIGFGWGNEPSATAGSDGKVLQVFTLNKDLPISIPVSLRWALCWNAQIERIDGASMEMTMSNWSSCSGAARSIRGHNHAHLLHHLVLSSNYWLSDRCRGAGAHKSSAARILEGLISARRLR